MTVSGSFRAAISPLIFPMGSCEGHCVYQIALNKKSPGLKHRLRKVISKADAELCRTVSD